MSRPERSNSLWYAYALHRLSGVVLAVFLPFHFYILSLTLTQPSRFDAFLHWADSPWVKFAEFGLVFLLAVHLAGGLRLMALEFLPWSAQQKTFAAVAVALSFLIAGLFYLSVL